MQAKRWAWRASAVIAVLVAAAAGWLLFHQLPARTPPRLLWTEADLPATPPPADNGWTLIGERAWTIQDGDLTQALNSAREGGDWDVARALAGRLSTETASRGFQRSLAVIDESISRPRFADACAATYTESCEVVRLLGHGKLVEAAIAKNALNGEWERALARLEPVLRARLDHAGSSRQLISGLLAAQQLQSALEWTRLIFAAAAREKVALRRQRVESIVALLKGPSDAGAPRRAVIADYLLTVSAIRMMAPRWRARNAPVVPRGAQWAEKLLIDGDQTLEMANAYYAAVMANVEGRPGVMPESAYRRRFGWWIYNPTGKLLLESVTSIGPHLRKLVESREKIQALREQALALAQDAAPKTMPPSSCDCITGDLVWGREHQSGIFRRRSSIVACREYTTRERPGSPTQGKPPVECTQAFAGCEIQGALVRLLDRSDVWAAFESAPPVYGADMSKRSDEPPVIVFHAGRKIRIGDPCDTVTSQDAGPSGCTPIPPGITELRTALEALDEAETGQGECAERWKALDGSGR